MSGREEARVVNLVERTHPGRMARHAAEWKRCAAIVDDAMLQLEAIRSRQAELGGRTGPTMARALAEAADVLRVKSRDLHRGGDALAELADATERQRNRKRDIDRDYPAGNQQVVAYREESSRQVADHQRSAFDHGISVMRSIGVDAPESTIDATPPGPVHVPPPTTTFWPLPVCPGPEIDLDLDPDDIDDSDDTAPAFTVAPGGHGVGPGSFAATDAPGAPGSPSGLGAGSLGAGVLGAGALGGAAIAARGALRGAAGATATPVASTGARALGGSGGAGAGGVLGRGGGAVGAGAGGGAGRGRKAKDRRASGDRDLHDDGEGWIDDEAGPGVLR